jgi:hypothetical protein
MRTAAKIDSASLAELRAAMLDQSPVSIGPRRTASPHEYYRYPARFSPSVAAKAIAAFTRPGDTVADYFVGGGTTLVEARFSGRLGFGSDINALATFVTKVKTRLYSRDELKQVGIWADAVAAVPTAAAVSLSVPDEALSYLRNFDDDSLYRHRMVVLNGLASFERITSNRARDFARCVLLRSAQWAFDMRREVPSAEEFRQTLLHVAANMCSVAAQATARYRIADKLSSAEGRSRSLVIQQGVPGLSGNKLVADCAAPRLVLTSPPYPGVYVNYHRWKIRGRLETPLPYLITGQLDGSGLAHYTMSSRSDRSLRTYFQKLGLAFGDIAAMCDSETWILQVVGFNNVETQLDRYLSTLELAGFEEVAFPQLATGEDGRLWRTVPGRRWWTRAGQRSMVAPHTAQEVLLVHRLR